VELTDERLAAAEPLGLDEELRGSMGVFKGTQNHEVVVDFDAWRADDFARTDMEFEPGAGGPPNGRAHHAVPRLHGSTARDETEGESDVLPEECFRFKDSAGQ
jgi:hypothetical protein